MLHAQAHYLLRISCNGLKINTMIPYPGLKLCMSGNFRFMAFYDEAFAEGNVRLNITLGAYGQASDVLRLSRLEINDRSLIVIEKNGWRLILC